MDPSTVKVRHSESPGKAIWPIVVATVVPFVVFVFEWASSLRRGHCYSWLSNCKGKMQNNLETLLPLKWIWVNLAAKRGLEL